ncbi:MAG: hydroxymethylbilane synthase [Alphaproteobacteria bacterium]
MNPMVQKVIRIGTRKSQLALIQTKIACAALRAYHPEVVFEVVALETTGDRIKDRPLADLGGKGLFTKEIEQALLTREIDLAVHSLKDMEAMAQEIGLAIGAVLSREDYRDILLTHGGVPLHSLPPGATVGTCSPRRKVQIQRMRNDLVVVPLRGNVDTRLKKLERGDIDAIILAVAGLKRLGLPLNGHILEPPEFLPAVGQGALALQIRTCDLALAELIAPLNDPTTSVCVEQERAMLSALNGNCSTPIAGLATLKDGVIELQGMLATEDGSTVVQHHFAQPIDQAAGLGKSLALQLLNMQRAQLQS